MKNFQANVGIFVFMIPFVAWGQSNEELWLKGWPEGERTCFVAKDGFGKETSRFCSVVVRIDGANVRMNHWTGSPEEENTTTRKSTNEYRLDKETGIFGSSGSTNLQFSPFEARGCLPIEPGRDCLKGLATSVEMKVQSKQFPNWSTAKLVEAYYAQDIVNLKVGSADETVKALRFTAKYRRNDGGEYIREYLIRTDSYYPISEKVWYKSSKAGVPEWVTEVYEIVKKQ